MTDERPDLVLIGTMLPDMSGLELTRVLTCDRDSEDLSTNPLTSRTDMYDQVQYFRNQSGTVGHQFIAHINDVTAQWFVSIIFRSTTPTKDEIL